MLHLSCLLFSIYVFVNVVYRVSERHLWTRANSTIPVSMAGSASRRTADRRATAPASTMTASTVNEVSVCTYIKVLKLYIEIYSICDDLKAPMSVNRT